MRDIWLLILLGLVVLTAIGGMIQIYIESKKRSEELDKMWDWLQRDDSSQSKKE